MDATYTLGRATFGDLSLSESERRRHLYISGKTGTGKSSLLLNLMLSDLANGRGFALIDPHGDLALSVADTVPRERVNSVVYLDPLDATHAVGFNPLQRVPPRQRAVAAAGIVSAFKNIWSESWGPRMEYILLHAVRLLLDIPGATLLHLPKILADDQYRDGVMRYATDPFTRYFWTREFAAYSERFRGEAIAPVQNKVGQFAANPMLRAIIGQPSTFDIDRMMNNGGILIANLSKQMGAEPSHLLGALLTTAFAQAAERRATIPESERKDFTLYADEFQNFATESFGMILSEARKWRLNLVLANQFLGQLPDTLRQAVLGNIGSLVVFRVGSEDAELLADELGMHMPSTLTDTPNFEAWTKTMPNGVPREPRPIQTKPPATRATGSRRAIVNHTHARFARTRGRTEQWFARLYS